MAMLCRLLVIAVCDCKLLLLSLSLLVLAVLQLTLFVLLLLLLLCINDVAAEWPLLVSFDAFLVLLPLGAVACPCIGDSCADVKSNRLVVLELDRFRYSEVAWDVLAFWLLPWLIWPVVTVAALSEASDVMANGLWTSRLFLTPVRSEESEALSSFVLLLFVVRNCPRNKASIEWWRSRRGFESVGCCTTCCCCWSLSPLPTPPPRRRSRRVSLISDDVLDGVIVASIDDAVSDGDGTAWRHAAEELAGSCDSDSRFTHRSVASSIDATHGDDVERKKRKATIEWFTISQLGRK